MARMVAPEILERTRLFMSSNEDVVISALDACRACIDADPDGAVGAAGRITAGVASAYFGWMKRTGEWPSVDKDAYDRKLAMARFVAERASPVLANGLVTEARCRHEAKLADMRRLFAALADADGRFLQRVFDEAQIETDAMLVGGETRAQIDGKTRDDVYGDAQTFYEAYVDGDLAGALRGFTHLRSVNPLDTYIRNMRGAILLSQGKNREALRDFLYAFRLDAGDANVAANLVRECATLGLDASVVELSRHYAAHRRDTGPADPAQQIDLFAGLSALTLQTVACAAARVEEADFDPDGSSALDALPSRERPWLANPQEDDSVDASQLHGARLFMSYRRADAAALVRRLHRELKTAHPSLHVFLDEAAMVGGEDFSDRLRDEIGRADVFLLAIGARWTSSEGLARLQKTADVLRREVAWALHKRIPIVPILLEEASMPAATKLPEPLRPILAKHADRVRSASFDADLARLDASLNRIVAERRVRKEGTSQELDEIFKADADEPETQRRFDELTKDWKETLPSVMKVRGRRGVGITARVELHGVWECAVTDADGLSSFRLVLDAPKRLTGEWRRHANDGRVLHRLELHGDWARVESEDDGVLLGIYLKYVLDGKTPLSWTIPFHDRTGDALVGTDDSGRRYVSRNVEPRVHGF